MKPSTRKSKSRSSGKAVAKYNGVALPKDASERRRMRNKLSAKAFRERKQDALNSARKEVEGCDAAINKLEMQLNDTRAKSTSLQSIMDAIKDELGPETVQHIFQQCSNQQEAGSMATTLEGFFGCRNAKSVTSDSEANMSSSFTSDDELSLGELKEAAV